jgi:hypothetical protein
MPGISMKLVKDPPSNARHREYHIAVIGSGGVGKSCLTGEGQTKPHNERQAHNKPLEVLIERSRRNSTIRPRRLHREL